MVEQEVNDLLAPIHSDVAALRRHLVDEQFLTRQAGVYWRSGGTVDVDSLWSRAWVDPVGVHPPHE
jgi:hypothetical protein